MNFIKEFDEIIDLFVKEITKFKQYIYDLNQCDEIIKKENNNPKNKITETTSNEKKLKFKEAEFDRLVEYRHRTNCVLANKNKLSDLIVKMQNKYNNYVELTQRNKENSENEMNDLLIESKKLEKELNNKRYTKEYKDNFYDNYFIETEKLKIMKQKRKEEKIKRREEELLKIEKEKENKIKKELLT